LAMSAPDFRKAATLKAGTANIQASLAEIWENTFLGTDCLVPGQRLVKELSKASPISQSKFRQTLSFVLKCLEQGGALSEEVKAGIVEDAEAKVAFEGIYSILVAAVRRKLKDSVFASDLEEVLFPEPYLADLVKFYTARREDLSAAATQHRDSWPTLSHLDWRVDVTISTSALSRVFKPSVTMQMTLSDGTIRTFECSLSKFHELRYGVARVLKDMQDLEHHPSLTRDL